jgi:hypothetical protein
MDEIGQSQIGTLGPQPTNSSESSRKVSYVLFLWPITGFILVVAAVVASPPLDDALIWWVGGVPCLVVLPSSTSHGEKQRAARMPDSCRAQSGWQSAACLSRRFFS